MSKKLIRHAVVVVELFGRPCPGCVVTCTTTVSLVPTAKCSAVYFIVCGAGRQHVELYERELVWTNVNMQIDELRYFSLGGDSSFLPAATAGCQLRSKCRGSRPLRSEPYPTCGILISPFRQSFLSFSLSVISPRQCVS